LRGRYEINLLAVNRNSGAPVTRLNQHRFAAGDVIAVQGFENRLAATLAEIGCLPLADRRIDLGRIERGIIPLGILAFAIFLMLTHRAPPEAAFFGAAVLIVLTKQISLQNAYAAIEGPVIVMLAALLPIGEALKDVGVTHIIAQHLTAFAAHLPVSLAVGSILAVSMIVTPIMHHAPAVVVMGPIAAELGKSLGHSVDPFLMAVALGAACDFLSPIGHQNNLLVKEPGGYRFGDYARLGLPLSLLVLLAGTPLILWAWPA
ncbi:MAG: SLC13 family permease, partial [Hyphomicrobiales bacterium]|nr:SLC13 family permease [Hyphomicrobiales bacterium]